MAMPRRERIGGAIANAGAEQGVERVRRERTMSFHLQPQDIFRKAADDIETYSEAERPRLRVPSSQTPGIAVLISNAGGCK